MPPAGASPVFDQLLKAHGHGRLWTERLPAIRARLEHHKRSGTLPTTKQGTLNRSAVLREFAPENKSLLTVVTKNPDVKALLDEYDVTQGDEGYSQYRYEALATKLKELLDSDELELRHARRINKKALVRKLGIPESALAETPKLNKLMQQKQAEVDQRQRRGTTAKAFRIHGADHINLGATPYSNAHKRVFDFSGLIPDYGLEFTEQVATTFIAVAGKLGRGTGRTAPGDALPEMGGSAAGDDDGAANARRTGRRPSRVRPGGAAIPTRKPHTTKSEGVRRQSTLASPSSRSSAKQGSSRASISPEASTGADTG